VLTRPIEISSASPGADRDVAVLGVYQAGGLVAGAAGVFGLVMSLTDDLPRRHRILGGTAALATSGLALGAVRSPVRLTALVRRELNAWTLPAGALASIALSGADRSPMFFPGLILIAIGGGRVGRTRLRAPRRTLSAAMGATAGISYLATVLLTRRPWQSGMTDSLRWSLGMVPAFLASAPIGGELGDLALSLRRVERMRARDRAAIDAAAAAGSGSLRGLSRRISETSRDLERTLMKIASADRSRAERQDSDVQLAIESIRTELRHHQLAPLLIAAANGEALDLGATLDGMLSMYRTAWQSDGIALSLSYGLPADMAIDARSTGALLRAAKVALDNSFKHQLAGRLTRVQVDVRSDHQSIRMTIADDGGAEVAPPESEWKTGLRETNALVKGLGGQMEHELAPKGLRVAVSLPLHPAAPPQLTSAAPVHKQVDAAVNRCGAIMRPANWLAGVQCLLTANDRKAGSRYGFAFSALVAADRLWARRAPGDRRRPRTVLALMGALWPAGGRPASGWIGMELILQGVLSDGWELALETGIATAASAVAAWRVRDTVERARRIENLLFLLVCFTCGAIGRYARARLVRSEREVLSLRERAGMIEELGRSIGYQHDVIKNLQASPAWYDDGIMESADGQRLLVLCALLDDLTQELIGSIGVSDPVRDIHAHLQLRLDPTAVVVTGEQPVADGDEDRDRSSVQRAREHLGVVTLADEIADRILRRFPPRLSGHPRLERVHVHMSPISESEMRVAMRPIPPASRPEGDLDGLVSALGQVAGDLIDGHEDGGFTFTIPASAISSR